MVQVDIVRTGSSLAVREVGASAIANMALDPKFSVSLVTGGAPAALAGLLRFTAGETPSTAEVTAQREAASAVANLAIVRGNSIGLLESTVPLALVAVMSRDPNGEAGQLAAAAIRNLSGHSASALVEVLGHHGLMAKLICVVENGGTGGQHASAAVRTTSPVSHAAIDRPSFLTTKATELRSRDCFVCGLYSCSIWLLARRAGLRWWQQMALVCCLCY